MKVAMLRFLSACGLGSLFLAISPPLRTNMMEKFAAGVHTMDANAPYSYIGAGVLILVIFLTSLSRGTQVR